MKSSFIVLALAGLAFAGIATPDARKAAPAFTLRDSAGASVRLSDYRGKVVLLNFWATTCGGCKVEIPWFMQFASKYQRKGLAVLGVSLDEDGWRAVKPYVKAKKINYRIVLGGDDVIRLYGVEAMPVTLLIDRNGRIADSHVGLVDRRACEDEIVRLLRN
jgi:peroxiredoxin